MRLVSWNVNGIRAALKNGFTTSVKNLNPDVICIQETKAQKREVELEGFTSYWNHADKAGYSGTAAFTKHKPLSVEYDMPGYNSEGRIITLEFKNFYLINVYTPNSGRELARLSYRKQWDEDFRKFALEKKKPVIICGDLNVAHKEIDIANPQGNKTTKTKPGNAGFTDQERESFTKLLDSGFIDTFRYFYPEKIQYTYWTYMFNARAKNKGWRMDYFCVSTALEKNLLDAKIHDTIHGSDHCPVELEIKT